MQFRDTIKALNKICKFDTFPHDKGTKHYYNVDTDLKSTDNFVVKGNGKKDKYFFIIQDKYTIVFSCYLESHSLSTMLTIYGLKDSKTRTENGFNSISICLDYPFDNILAIANIIDSKCVKKLKLCMDYIKMIMKMSSIEIDTEDFMTEFATRNECSYRANISMSLKKIKSFDADEVIHMMSLIYDVNKNDFSEILASIDSYEYFGNVSISPFNKNVYKFAMLYPGYKEIYLKFSSNIYIQYTDENFKVIIPSSSNIALFKQKYESFDECEFLLTLLGFNDFDKLHSLLPKHFVD